MSWCTDVVELKTKEDIFIEANEFAEAYTDRYENPDGDYHGNLKITDLCFTTREDAENYLNEYHERGRDLAVRFKDISHFKVTKKEKELEDRCSKLREQRSEVVRKLRKKETKTNRAKLESIDNRLNKYEGQLKEINKRKAERSNKYLWLVKLSVHC